MSVYGGFDPGTFQAWSLNLFSNIFLSPGIARGFTVTQNSPAGMSVLATLDPTANDGVVYLSNGAWVRIDSTQTFSIGANSSGSTRTDALVAEVDPANSSNFSLGIQANWANGFVPGANQFVIALISVANGASSITNGNITMNSAQASVKLTNTSGISTLIASDGVGLTLTDNSASSQMLLVPHNLPLGNFRQLILQPVDASGIGHQFVFGQDGGFQAPAYFTLNPNNVNGGGKTWQIFVNAGDGHIQIQDQTDNIDAIDIDTTGSVFVANDLHATGKLFTGTYLVPGVPGLGNNWITVMDMIPSGTPTVNANWRLVYGGDKGSLIFYDATNGNTAVDINTDGTVNLNYLSPATAGKVAILASNGGGAPGRTVWTGTTDPGALALEGDVWVDG